MKALTIFLTSGLFAFSASAQVGVSGGDGVRALALLESSAPAQDHFLPTATNPPLARLESSASAQAEDRELRPDIDKDIPLAEAVRRVNEQFPDAQPLTEDEVVAAVRAIKLTQPDIKEDTYEQYMRVVKERVLPKEMYFSRTTAWNTQYGLFQVDWKDLTIRGHVATAAEKAEVMSKLSKNVTFAAKELRVGGFTYRIRARFVSSTEQTPTR